MRQPASIHLLGWWAFKKDLTPTRIRPGLVRAEAESTIPGTRGFVPRSPRLPPIRFRRMIIDKWKMG
jgi:hypothetical protein